MIIFRREIFPKKFTLFAGLAVGLLMSFSSQGQLDIDGPTNITIDISYSYSPTYNGSGGDRYTGFYTWTVEGGYLTESQGTILADYSDNYKLNTLAVNVTWTSSSGSLTFSSDLGDITIYISETQSIDPGAISPLSQSIDAGSSASTITGTAASGGDPNPSYTYQWQYSSDGITWSNLAYETGQDLSPGVLYETIYYRRKATETVSGGVGYTSTAEVIVAPPVSATISPSSQVINAGNSTTTITSSISGGNGTTTYQWQTSTNSVVWSNVSTASTYNPGVLYSTRYYRLIVTSNGISSASNTAVVTVCGSSAGPISGNTTVTVNSTTQLDNAVTGGSWSSSNTSIAQVDATGVVTGIAPGSATITYAINNACGSSSSQLGITVVAFSNLSQSLGAGIADPVITDTISLVQGTVKATEFVQDTLYSLAHSIKNVLALRVIEETSKYIPGDFSATAVLKVEYGHSQAQIYQIDSIKLSVTYTKNAGNKYNALNYFTFNNAEFTRITVLRVEAPTTVASVSFDTKQVLQLTNSLAGTRYYKLADNKRPVLSYTNPAGGTVPDALQVGWVLPAHTQNNAVQLEWAWLENEMQSSYVINNVFDTALLFKTSSTRLDLPGATIAGGYHIPLLYDGVGKLYMRARAVNLMPIGSRSDGPWSWVQAFAFNGHNDSLNWQSTTTYAEEGKRKTVIQYYDGSLRPRQTVTKDNTTGQTVVAETFYDKQGRPAVQILPAPGISNIIAYTKNLNKFNTQADNTDPADYFDFTTASLGNYATNSLSENSGTANYYSAQNPDANTGFNKNIPAANGYAFAVTRYTPDATGRIMRQSGVGDSLKMGSGHETKYFYGTPAQEELDALFGTEVGNYTHYFKNMVQDGNGQMSISYVDMHGRTIATALAGNAPTNLQALNISDTNQYKNQAGKILARNLLDRGSNILKENSIESINSVLVPFNTNYSFSYQLTKQTLTLPKCGGGTVSYDCKFDLQISVADESGDTNPVVYNYTGIDNINFNQALLLDAGSYSIRKTLTINQDSLDKFIAQYNTYGVGFCQTQQYLIDSIIAQDSTASGCGATVTSLTSSSCLSSLGTYAAYLSSYAASIGLTTGQLTASQLNDIRNQYISDSSFCVSLNQNTSSSLEATRQQMLADMVPYSGQYARDTGTVSMANKYRVFSTSGSSGYTQPFYKYPRSQALAIDNYYDAFGNIDSSVLSASLLTMTMQDFEQGFKESWTKSLLPYHPEFKKLKFAEDSLRSSFNFIDSIQLVTAAFTPINSDPFFAISSRAADKDTITKYSNVAWTGMNNYSMWQLAYGDAFGCKTILDNSAQSTCYNNMPKVFTATGTSVNTGSGSVMLSATIQSQAWDMYKAMYGQVRGDMVNRYINVRPGTTDTTDNRTLINQGFRIYFPYNYVQAAQNNGWAAWYPGANGTTSTNVSLTDSVALYSNHCGSYINTWRAILLDCPALAAKDSASREAILNSITGKMQVICKNGTDGANPYGSSTVAPAYSGSAYTSFEQAIDYVLDSAGIARNLYCHPYGIEWPKPYGKNPPITNQYITALDTCTCSQWGKLKTEVTAAGYNSNSLTSINQYLLIKYQDSITTTLYNGLQQCSSSYNTIPLLNPQPQPVFLNCGFDSSSYKCYSCTDFTSLDNSFYTLFGKHPVFYGTITSDSVIAWNDLFAKYVNFKTGLQHTWQYYAGKFQYSCVIGGIPPDDGTVSICLERKPLNDTTGLLTTIASPCQQAHNNGVVKGTIMYEYLQQQIMANFKAAYLDKCLTVTELFNVTDTLKEYHYTLYYYDQAGNLVKTVPPKGVRPDYSSTFLNTVKTERDKMVNDQSWTPTVPQHSLVTRYCYNSLSQVVIQKSPDGGVGKFWYDRLGRLAVSQNAKQAISNQYSYTYYDSLGRIAEVGQLTSSTVITDATAKSQSSLQTWFNNVTSSRNQITQTIYDAEYGPINGVALSQKNLRNRVSYSQVINNATDTYPASATYYTYDIHGSVDTLLQDFGNSSGIVNAMNQSGNRFKKIVYNYDLISGKVNQVSYQPGQPDAYYHRYSYDGENRLIDVYSGRDSVMLFLFPEREAHYDYYKHGALARTILGQLQVQKQDYVYALQGWLKAVNPDNSVSGVIAKNVYNFVLNYYNNDYTGIGATSPSAGIPSQLGADNKPLFNGNISSMGLNIPKLGNSILYNFQYDQLHRLVSMDAWTSTNDAWAGLNKVNDYKEQLSYDANGNILSYLRNGTGSSLNLNNYTYSYTAGTNRLASITNSVNSTAGTYNYDAIGNVTKDDKQNVNTANWNVYGKLLNVTKTGGTQINYTYSADGNRVLKIVADTTEAYVRDGSGNILSIYMKTGNNSLRQTELTICGNSIIGKVNQFTAPIQTITLSGGFGVGTIWTFTRGEKEYPISDHRGNNMASISDRRQQYSSAGTTVDYYLADVKTAAYYSIYGVISNSYNGDSIKYAFNGQKRSVEISASAQTALFWEYDGDVGRRWNLDPKPNASISSYAVLFNNPMVNTDVLGDTSRFFNASTGALLDEIYDGEGNNNYEINKRFYDGSKEKFKAGHSDFDSKIGTNAEFAKEFSDHIIRDAYFDQYYYHIYSQGKSLFEELHEPDWLIFARKKIGINEDDNCNDIIEYHQINREARPTTCGAAWCASFVGYCLDNTGFNAQLDPGAAAYSHSNTRYREVTRGGKVIRAEYYGDPVWGESVTEAFTGAIVVLKHGSQYHVTFLVAKSANGQLYCLGGNQGDQVKISAYTLSSTGYSVVGYMKPGNYTIPANARPVPIRRYGNNNNSESTR